jgi:hypothetical protein
LGFIVIGTVITVNAFAQENAASAQGNWISAELDLSLVGIGTRYERMLGSQLSVGVNAYWSSLFSVWNELGTGVFMRFYPGGKNFFIGAGVGFRLHTAITSSLDYEITTGVAIVPELGWKISVGNTSNFFYSTRDKIAYHARY